MALWPCGPSGPGGSGGPGCPDGTCGTCGPYGCQLLRDDGSHVRGLTCQGELGLVSPQTQGIVLLRFSLTSFLIMASRQD